MKLGRWSAVCWLVAGMLWACGKPEVESSGGSAGAAGKLGQAGSSSGASSGGGAGNGASAGDAARGGSGDVTAGGAPDQGGESADGGAPGDVDGKCVPPQTVPVSGSDCSAACKLVAYEDCDGAGLVQAACGGEWFLIEQTCGSHKCLDPAFDGQSCGAGMVCTLQQGGAQIPECRPHACGTGPITCDCLADVCPGCQQTGVLDFTCNTCPAGQQCP
jgi:hypothetical protein